MNLKFHYLQILSKWLGEVQLMFLLLLEAEKFLLEGDYQEINPDIPNAFLTYIDQDVWINANANENGDGGRVVIWADWVTSFHGKVESCGGKHGGNGGLVQISGDAFLDYQGLVDTRAKRGCTGTLILKSQ